jgi:hypothetical protein
LRARHRASAFASQKSEQGMFALPLRNDGRIATVVNAAAQALTIDSW